MLLSSTPRYSPCIASSVSILMSLFASRCLKLVGPCVPACLSACLSVLIIDRHLFRVRWCIDCETVCNSLVYTSLSQPGARGSPRGATRPSPGGHEHSRPELNSQARFSIAINWSYLCESGFSDLVTIKTKDRNRLDVRSDIRLAVSKTEPNIKGLIRRGQEQVLHWRWLY